ncbi:hypothetical protein BDZ97DRAFT_1924134 [Flammula alnicola]|nr:hypothetical protein BDZ97DRAFT_1924134 [Flammula alnicola]
MPASSIVSAFSSSAPANIAKDHPPVESSHGRSPNDPSLKWGGGKKTLKGSILKDYVCRDYDWLDFNALEFRFVEYVHVNKISEFLSEDKHKDAVPFKLPLHHLVDLISVPELQDLALLHNMQLRKRDSKKIISQILEDHHCDTCDKYFSFFNFFTNDELKDAEKKCRVPKSKHKDSPQSDKMDVDVPEFPPRLPSLCGKEVEKKSSVPKSTHKGSPQPDEMGIDVPEFPTRLPRLCSKKVEKKHGVPKSKHKDSPGPDEMDVDVPEFPPQPPSLSLIR